MLLIFNSNGKLENVKAEVGQTAERCRGHRPQPAFTSVGRIFYFVLIVGLILCAPRTPALRHSPLVRYLGRPREVARFL